MPKITFYPSGKTQEVELGTTLFDAARSAGLPVSSSCDADATCGKCNMRVTSGGENLSLKTEWEGKLLRKEGKPVGDRISCMAKVVGDCTVTTTYW